MIFYIKDLNLFWCSKDDQLNYIIKRRCGIKINQHWFLDVYEAYYLYAYQEIKINIKNEFTLSEIVNQFSQIKDFVMTSIDYLQQIDLNVHQLCAYIQIRNQDKFLRTVLNSKQIDIINQQLAENPRKKVKKEDNIIYECNYLYYDNLKDYKENQNFKFLYLKLFKEQVDYSILYNCQNIVGLMENNEVKLINLTNI